MKNWIISASKLLLATAIVTATACKKDDDDDDKGPKNVFELAKADNDIKMFATAFEKAGLKGKLTGGSITLLAPTDQVFEGYLSDLGYSTVEDWIAVTKSEIVEQVLLYHVVDGKKESSDLLSGYYKTLAVNDNDDKLDLLVKGGTTVSINGNTTSIVSADINASNGYIQIINGMLEPKTISGLLEVNGDFSILLEAASMADGNIMSTLGNENTTHTILAPNNAAFNVYFGENPDIDNVNEMASQLGADGLQDVLDYHILLGNIRVDNFSNSPFTTNLSGMTITISENGANYRVIDETGRQASFFANDITATNGNIHIISNVMLPSE